MDELHLDRLAWLRRVLRAFGAHVSVSRIVDLGCGDGAYATLRMPGQFWTGIDVRTEITCSTNVRGLYDAVLNLDFRELDWSQLAPVHLAIFGHAFDELALAEAEAVLSKAAGWAKIVVVSVLTTEADSFPRRLLERSAAACPFAVLSASEGNQTDFVIATHEPERTILHAIGVQLAQEEATWQAELQDAGRAGASMAATWEFAHRWLAVRPQGVIRIVERLVEEAQNVAEHIFRLRLLAALKEQHARANHGDVMRGLADLPFRYAAREITRWRQMAEALVAEKPRSAGGLMWLAEACLVQGGGLEAEPYFARLRSLDLKENTASVANFAPEFHSGLEGAASANATHLPPMRIIALRGRVTDRLLFTACDPSYFSKYAEPLVASVARYADPDVTMAVHIFDGTAEELRDIAARLPASLAPNLVFSTEWTGLRGTSTTHERAYYHAMRFLRFHQILERHQTTAGWSLDADILFNRPPRALFDLLEGHDCAYWLLPARVEVHSQICASHVGISASLNGRRYLARVAGYLATYQKHGRLTWGIDQVAMYAVAALMHAENPPIRIAPTPPQIHNGDFSPTAVLWPGKCAPESADYGRFTELVTQLRREVAR